MPHECTDCGRSFADGSKEMLSGCPDCGGNKFRYRPEGGRLETPDDGDDDGNDSTAPADSPPDPVDSGGSPQGRSSDAGTDSGRSTAADAVGDAAATLRSLVGGAGSDPDRPVADAADVEDAAQASARGGVVDPDEIAAADDRRPDDAPPADADPDSETEGGPAAATDSDGPTVERVRPEADDEAGADAADAADDGEGTELTGADDPAGDTNLAELREELNDQFESIRIVEPGQYELNLMELYDREEYIVSLMEDGRYAIEVPETWREDR